LLLAEAMQQDHAETGHVGAPEGANHAVCAHALRTTLPRLLLSVLGIAGLAACPGRGPDASEENETPAAKPASADRPAWLDVGGERLGPLPSQAPASSARFATSDLCAQCHSAGDGKLEDESGRDVSPFGTWRASSMALAARDPYYLAAFADELAFRPNLTSIVEATCTRCHAPEASVELELEGKVPTFAMLTGEVSNVAHLGREGVSCTLCHQIEPDGLGSLTSFTGAFKVGESRRIYGPYQDPRGDFMLTVANYAPTYGAHIQKSALCATCHTVITQARDAKGHVGPAFAEQAPYLEWLASDFRTEDPPGDKAADCQDCHMPAADDDGRPLSQVIAKRPDDLAPRTPFRRHGFAGANVMLSRFGAAEPSWFGVPLEKKDHEAQASANEAMLRSSAKLAVSTERRGEGIEVAVTVSNEAGHKFPTGYPSRRAVLHVVVTGPSGDVIFESGKMDAYGRLVSGSGEVAEPSRIAPHLDVIDDPAMVQIYESVPIDASGKVAHRPLDAVRYGKDNRLLPAGFDRKSRYSAYTAPVGTDGDANWGSSDLVTYRVPKVPPGAKVEVELLFQVARPADIEAFAHAPTPAARKLFDFATAAPPVPVVIAAATARAP
jgi:hypothetical protein